MTRWVSPVPAGVGAAAKVFRPGRDMRQIADVICERAWKNDGVRVFRWPCGTVVVVRVGSQGDKTLTLACEPRLLATYARLHVPGSDARGPGPSVVEVLHDLHWAKATAA
jgi:hypothetical protein